MDSSLGDTAGNMRERELELEIARLNAEVESLRGEGEPTDVAARFLAMAASTVDQAMEEARREADEFAAEISAEAEARRDEATRIAEEAEVRAEGLRTEAEQSETVVRQAAEDADQIRAAAELEASELVTSERTRLADELEILSGVRTALEEERGALESYHEELQRRVQELAESMVSFMTTEPPIGAVRAIDDLSAPALAPADPEAGAEYEEAAEYEAAVEYEPVAEYEPGAEYETVAEYEEAAEYEPVAETETPVETVPAETAAEIAEDTGVVDELDEEEVAPEMAFVEYVIEPAPDAPEVPDAAPAPPTFHDMMAAPSADEFDGVPVVEDPADAADAPVAGGLFGRATDDEQDGSAGLFGSHGARLIEQTSPDQLAAALADEDDEDERFRSFIDGDDDGDPSRDWLLRPEQH